MDERHEIKWPQLLSLMLKDDIFGHLYLFSLLQIEIFEIILTIGINIPS